MLSKSKVIRGLQCKKSLWLYTHHYNWQDKVSAAQQAVFDTGNIVGELAQQLWPEGIDVSEGERYPNRKCAKRTKELLAQGQEVIYEATFIYNNTLVAVDILARENGLWNAYEVKSSTSVKDVNLDDASVQYYVLKGAGIELENISIVFLNRAYIRKRNIDLKQLFVIENVTDYVIDYQENMAEIIRELNDLVEDTRMPKMDIGSHCGDPYMCSFMGHCWKHVPDYSVFDISRISSNKAFDLYEKGIVELKDIPDDYPLSEHQRIQVESERSQQEIIDCEGLTRFINDLNYPLYFLDYETINPAIPMFKGMGVYEQIPFLYSIHIQENPDDDYRHIDYLAGTNGEDCREKFIKQLICDCGQTGDIIVYNVSFERRVTQGLSQAFPKYAVSLDKIISRMKDLMIPFQKKMYYTAAMEGSYSIKKVLPALVPQLSYDKMTIQDGEVASAIFKSYFTSAQHLPEETKKALLEYCKMDTWAMVKLLEKIKLVIQ